MKYTLSLIGKLLTPPIPFLAIGVFLMAEGIKDGQGLAIACGIFFILGGMFFFFIMLREFILRIKYYKKCLQEERYKLGLTDELPEEDEEETEEYEYEDEEYEEEPIEAQYDNDSGLEYCPHCGNYSVSEGRCKVCSERTEVE